MCRSKIQHSKVNASVLKAYNHPEVSSLFCVFVLLFFLKNDKKNPNTTESNFMCLGVAI